LIVRQVPRRFPLIVCHESRVLTTSVRTVHSSSLRTYMLSTACTWHGIYTASTGYLAISPANRSFLSINQGGRSPRDILRSIEEALPTLDKAIPSLNQGVRSLNRRFLRLNEALIKLNEWVHLAKWPLIRLAQRSIKLAQPRIRHKHTLPLAKLRLI